MEQLTGTVSRVLISVSNTDLDWIRIQLGLWIRIQIHEGKNERKKWINFTFHTRCSLFGAGHFSWRSKALFRGLRIKILNFFSKISTYRYLLPVIFLKFLSSTKTWIWIPIPIWEKIILFYQKVWIRIRIQTIWIRKTGFYKNFLHEEAKVSGIAEKPELHL